MEDILSLKEAVLVYLDKSGGLQKLIHDCRHFNDPLKVKAVYRFCISVNPSDLLEVDAVLGDSILRDPIGATALFQSVCFLAIQTLSLVEKIITENQVHVILRLTHLPPFPEYMLDLCSSPRGSGLMRPVCMEGLVIAITRVTKYTQGARFLCTNDDCACSTGFHYIRVHAPGATESATVRKDFSCLICCSPLKEDVKFRVLGDKQLVELVHVKALDALSANQQGCFRYQSATLFLRDELCNSMRIGRLYRVLGIPAHVHQWPNITWSVETNNVQLWEPESLHGISSGFQELLKATAGSPWRFSAVVAHCFGLDLAPPGLYNTLKLALLLSLVQNGAGVKDTFQHLDLLVVTTDTLMVDRIMTYSLGLANRGVRHQASRELFTSLSRDDHGAGTANIQAGSVLLATGGVCLLGDLGFYKRTKWTPSNQKAAQSQFSFRGRSTGRRLMSSFLPSAMQPLGYHGCLQTEMGPIPIQLADAFGLVVQCQDLVGEPALLAQTFHTLQKAVQPGKPLYSSCWTFSTQEYKELVAHAQSLQVELSPGAEKIIHGYYMASRRVRTQSQGVKISLASIKLLISLSEAHAKLCLRTTVLEEDAVIAVLLCENSVTLKHGASALVIPPDAVFPCDLGDVDGLHRRDVTLEEIHQNILRFIYAYAPGAETYITEE